MLKSQLFLLSVLGTLILFSDAIALELREGVTLKDFKSFETQRITLTLLLESEDLEGLRELQTKNLKTKYLTTLYFKDPDSITSEFLEHRTLAKLQRNRTTLSDANLGERSFTKLYYLIKLKDTTALIGTLEIATGDLGNAQIGLFIDQERAHQRYGTETVKATVELIRTKTTATEIAWESYADNKGSTGVAKNCSFVHEYDHTVIGGKRASRYSLKLNQAVNDQLVSVSQASN